MATTTSPFVIWFEHADHGEIPMAFPADTPYVEIHRAMQKLDTNAYIKRSDTGDVLAEFDHETGTVIDH